MGEVIVLIRQNKFLNGFKFMDMD